jgi:hypothetical protein
MGAVEPELKATFEGSSHVLVSIAETKRGHNPDSTDVGRKLNPLTAKFERVASYVSFDR